jgi:glucan 1,3-beta-glucosidase
MKFFPSLVILLPVVAADITQPDARNSFLSKLFDSFNPPLRRGGDQDPLLPPSCPGPVKGNASGFWLDKQDHTGSPRGYAPFIDGYFTYPVYRNVLHYNAKNDGTGDQSDNLQNAMNTDGRGRNRYQNGLTFEPAEVFLPGGTYQIKKQLDLRMGTIIVGDPNNPPVIKASSDFNGDTVVNGYDFATGHHETSFMTLLKNVIIDTTAVNKDRTLLALQWGVAQGCGMTNVKIIMPDNSNGHTGIRLDGGSTIAVTDVVSLWSNSGISGLKLVLTCHSISMVARLVSETPISR